MKAVFFLLPPRALLLFGCVHTREIGIGPSDMTAADMYEGIDGKNVQVTLNDNRTFNGTVKAVVADTIHLLPDGSAEVTPLPVRALQRVHQKGSALNPIVGAILAGTLGGVVGSALTSNSWWNGWDGAFVGGLLGAIAGGILGDRIAPTYDYVIHETTAESEDQLRLIRIPRFLEETDTSVTFMWVEKKVSLQKAMLTIERKEDGIYLKGPHRYFRQKGIL
jgi:hypothetical protein